MFGDGVRAGRVGKRGEQAVPRDVAEAFLRIVLIDRWSVKFDAAGNEVGIPYPTGIDLEKAIKNACDAMFQTVGEPHPVYCKPSPGQGPFGLYTECGENGASIIVATQHAPVVMPDPSTQIRKWLELLHSLFFPEKPVSGPGQAYPIHIWAVLEPLIDPQPNAIKAQEGIANLHKVFWIVNNLVNAQREPSRDTKLWETLKRRGVIAIKKNPRNQSNPRPFAITGDLFIDETVIFPPKVPDAWFSAGGFRSQDAGDLNSIVRIEGNSERYVGYYVFGEYDRPPFFVARNMPRLGRAKDENFLNLYYASLQFADGQYGDAFINASKEGWVFLNIKNVLGMSLPVSDPAEIQQEIAALKIALRKAKTQQDFDMKFLELMRLLNVNLDSLLQIEAMASS